MVYIDKNLRGTLTVSDISKYLGYSEYHFSRIFKECMKTTVMDYVRKRKLINASLDIIRGQRIIDVALKYGWLSHAGFTKAFKKEYRFSPIILKALVMQVNEAGGSLMGHVFLYKTDEKATKKQLYEILINKLNYLEKESKIKNLEKIYQVSLKAYHGVKRYSGDEYITHPLHVAILLAEMEAEEAVVLSGLLCDVLKKGNISVDTIERELPTKVKNIVFGLNEFNPCAVDITTQEEIVMVKLAERLHNMRTIGFMDEKSQRKKALETVNLFMPIARKLENQKLMEELNDLALKNILE